MKPPQRTPQRLPTQKDADDMLKTIRSQFKLANNKLLQSLTKAEEMLRANKAFGSYDAGAVVQLGVILFQLEMSKEQGLMKHKSMLNFIEAQKNHPNRPA